MKSETEIRTEYTENIKRLFKDYMGDDCFNYKCSGVMSDPVKEGHVLSCSVCGTGLRLPPFNEWVNGRINGMKYKSTDCKDQIEYNKDKIQELKKKIEELKADNRGYMAEIKDLRPLITSYKKTFRRITQ